jgi:hypothetical protein
MRSFPGRNLSFRLSAFSPIGKKKFMEKDLSFLQKKSRKALLRKKGPGELYLSEGIYSPVTLDDNRILRFVAEIQKTWVNGGCWVRCVESTEQMIQQSFGNENYWKEFFKSTSLRACLPELKIPDEVKFPDGIAYMRRYQFEGVLTDILLAGGAYEKFQGTPDEARQIAKDCVEALDDNLGKPENGFGITSIGGYWTPAFHDVAWDEAFVLSATSSKMRRWIFLWMTDTD